MTAPRMVVLTAEQITSKLAELRADLAAWRRLETRWGYVGALTDEISTYEWLLGSETSMPVASENTPTAEGGYEQGDSGA